MNLDTLFSSEVAKSVFTPFWGQTLGMYLLAVLFAGARTVHGFGPNFCNLAIGADLLYVTPDSPRTGLKRPC